MFLNNWFNKITNITKIKQKDKIKICIDELSLPKVVNASELDDIIEETSNLFNTYKSLGYVSKDIDELNDKEWNMWEFSVILKACKHKIELKIDDKDDIFPKFIFEISRKQLEGYFQFFLEVYDKQERIDFSKGKLQSEKLWTPRDMTCLFYYLTVYEGSN